MNEKKRHRQRGFSLLELLVYIVIFAMGVNLCVSALGTGARLSSTTALQLGRIEGIRAIQETFTGYVRRAAAVSPGAGGYNTGPDRVVLQMPPDQPEGFDVLVLGAVRDPSLFSVLGLKNVEGTWTEVYMKTLRQPLGKQELTIDHSGIRPLVSLDLQVGQEEGERARTFLVHRSSAVPRGMEGSGQ
mgnify:CR=1 FL=1